MAKTPIDGRVAPHQLLEWIGALLERLCIQGGTAEDALPDRPTPTFPAPEPEGHDDLDELKRILRDNPVLRHGIQTGELDV